MGAHSGGGYPVGNSLPPQPRIQDAPDVLVPQSERTRDSVGWGGVGGRVCMQRARSWRCLEGLAEEAVVVHLLNSSSRSHCPHSEASSDRGTFHPRSPEVTEAAKSPAGNLPATITCYT